jgi:hypothetical protein
MKTTEWITVDQALVLRVEDIHPTEEKSEESNDYMLEVQILLSCVERDRNGIR